MTSVSAMVGIKFWFSLHDMMSEASADCLDSYQCTYQSILLLTDAFYVSQLSMDQLGTPLPSRTFPPPPLSQSFSRTQGFDAFWCIYITPWFRASTYLWIAPPFPIRQALMCCNLVVVSDLSFDTIKVTCSLTIVKKNLKIFVNFRWYQSNTSNITFIIFLGTK